MKTHLFIPDTQVRPDTPTNHLEWLGEYIVDREPDLVIHIGDHWDMPSLSSYAEKGAKSMEGKRYSLDVAAGNSAIELIRAPSRKRKTKTKFKRLLGNHEIRIATAIEKDPKLEGSISLDDLESPDWDVHGYLEPVWADGVCYSHYFYHPLTGRPYGGGIENRLKQIGHSFTMGHQQILMYGVRFVAGKSQHGLVAGSFYLHDEGYKGPQGNAHWRGIVVKHEVNQGSYNPMFVSLDYLCRRYEGCSLEHFKKLNKIKSLA